MAMKALRVVGGKVVNSEQLRQLKREAKRSGKPMEIYENMQAYKEAEKAKANKG